MASADHALPARSAQSQQPGGADVDQSLDAVTHDGPHAKAPADTASGAKRGQPSMGGDRAASAGRAQVRDAHPRINRPPDGYRCKIVAARVRRHEEAAPPALRRRRGGGAGASRPCRGPSARAVVPRVMTSSSVVAFTVARPPST